MKYSVVNARFLFSSHAQHHGQEYTRCHTPELDVEKKAGDIDFGHHQFPLRDNEDSCHFIATIKDPTRQALPEF